MRRARSGLFAGLRAVPSSRPVHPGQPDLDRAATELAHDIPEPLGPLARVAYDYRWSWTPGGHEVFAAVDAERWERVGRNPVRLLRETSRPALERAAGDGDLVRRAADLEAVCRADAERPAHAPENGTVSAERPVAFVCAEFGVHRSLPIYSGGLGALAGDMLKEASDAAFPLVGVGLLYRQGYFRQRVDVGGLQHEYWVEADPGLMPMALVTGEDGAPLRISVPISGDEVQAQIWRVNVGRVPLYLLDTDLPENSPVARWTTARLYVGDPQIRLAQYAMLGVGAVRACAALGLEPSVFHLNEGHGALAALELAREPIGDGVPLDRALEDARREIVFTTHTPVPAGNDTYPAARAIGALGAYAREIGLEDEQLLRLGRTDPLDLDEEFGITQLALRTSRGANGVSRRHGRVAREMWASLWPGRVEDGVPITHVTNGVHVPTWVGPEMRDLFDRHLGESWLRESEAPATWEALARVPDEELWAARCAQRTRLVEHVRRQSVVERLGRGEDFAYVEAAARVFDPDTLTIGFARRLATYKRLDLLARDVERAVRLLGGRCPIQFVLAGKAHPKRHGRQGAGGEALRQPRDGRPGRARRLPRRLRPGPRRAPGPGLRRVAQPPAPAAGGQRHQRHEVRPQRRPAAQRSGRLVGRGLRPRPRLVDQRRGRRRPRGAGRPRRAGAVPAPGGRGRPRVLRARRRRPARRVDRADARVDREPGAGVQRRADAGGLSAEGVRPGGLSDGSSAYAARVCRATSAQSNSSTCSLASATRRSRS